VKTFEERFCEAHQCTSEEFVRRVFWKCLHRHALPIAPVLLAVYPRYFDADRELILGVRRAVKMGQVWEEVREFFINPRHTGWLRRKVNIRVSARRLIDLAREYLPTSGGPPRPPLEDMPPSTTTYSLLES